jgi:hypothetical protein
MFMVKITEIWYGKVSLPVELQCPPICLLLAYDRNGAMVSNKEEVAGSDKALSV